MSKICTINRFSFSQTINLNVYLSLFACLIKNQLHCDFPTLDWNVTTIATLKGLNLFNQTGFPTYRESSYFCVWILFSFAFSHFSITVSHSSPVRNGCICTLTCTLKGKKHLWGPVASGAHAGWQFKFTLTI